MTDSFQNQSFLVFFFFSFDRRTAYAGLKKKVVFSMSEFLTQNSSRIQQGVLLMGVVVLVVVLPRAGGSVF